MVDIDTRRGSIVEFDEDDAFTGEEDDGALEAFFFSTLCTAFVKKSRANFLILACFSSENLSSFAVAYDEDFFSFSAIATVH